MKSLLFIEPLFHSVVHGEKTQTRRALSKTAIECIPPNCNPLKYLNSQGKRLSRFKLDEIVYLAEPWRTTTVFSIDDIDFEFKFSKKIINENIMYGPDYGYKIKTYTNYYKLQIKSKSGWINKLFAPTWLHEHFPIKAKITGVRAEYLQDITEDECKLEGCSHIGTDKWVHPLSKKIFETGIDAFKSLIESRGVGKKGDWDKNPLVWVYDFKVVK